MQIHNFTGGKILINFRNHLSIVIRIFIDASFLKLCKVNSLKCFFLISAMALKITNALNISMQLFLEKGTSNSNKNAT